MMASTSQQAACLDAWFALAPCPSMPLFPLTLRAGKWPDELEPYQKTKAALGCQLAQQLHTALGLDATATEVGV